MHNVDDLMFLFFAIAAGFATYLIGTIWLMWKVRSTPHKVWMVFAGSMLLAFTWACSVGLIRIGV